MKYRLIDCCVPIILLGLQLMLNDYFVLSLLPHFLRPSFVSAEFLVKCEKA